MRIEGGRSAVCGLALGAALVAQTLGAAAQRTAPGPMASRRPEMRIEVAPLVPGTVATADVFVRLPAGYDQPLLLTPRVEGAAVHVLRGRLLRADARGTVRGELHFRVPLEVRSEGTAVLRIVLSTYCCEAHCQPVRVTATRTVEARAR